MTEQDIKTAAKEFADSYNMDRLGQYAFVQGAVWMLGHLGQHNVTVTLVIKDVPNKEVLEEIQKEYGNFNILTNIKQ